MATTITEALAEIKTINKRLASKREFIGGVLFRQDAVRDPHEKDGGSAYIISTEIQSINDLQERVVYLRRAVQRANEDTVVTIKSITRSIADWLVWRRDVLPDHKSFLERQRATINNMRNEAKRQGLDVRAGAGEAVQRTDIVININEKKLAEDLETIEDITGTLDGILSLKNATVICLSG